MWNVLGRACTGEQSRKTLDVASVRLPMCPGQVLLARLVGWLWRKFPAATPLISSNHFRHPPCKYLSTGNSMHLYAYLALAVYNLTNVYLLYVTSHQRAMFVTIISEKKERESARREHV